MLVMGLVRLLGEDKSYNPARWIITVVPKSRTTA
jgi:hypothetical protein